MSSSAPHVRHGSGGANGSGQAGREILQGALLYDELTPAVDERTIAILDRRRRTIRRRGWLVRRALLAADVLGLTLAFAAAEIMLETLGVSPQTEIILFFASLPGWILGAKLFGLYDRDEERADYSTTDDFVRVFLLVTVVVFLITQTAMLLQVVEPNLRKLAVFWGLSVLLVTSSRVTARALCRKSIDYLQNTVIVGAGDVGQLLAHKVLQHPEYGINLVGFVDDDPRKRRGDLDHLAILGPPERLPAIVRMLDVERVVVAFSNQSTDQTLDLIRSLKSLDVQIDVVPRFFEIVGTNVGIHTIEGVPLVGLPPLRLSRSSRFVKRGVDLALSVLGLALLVPLFAVIAILIKRESPGPVLFRQLRMGADDKTFWIYKFRTMIVDAEEQRDELQRQQGENGGDPSQFKLRDDPRNTRLGRRLRRYSLDELPQLVNVVKGEMSLVGPRPLPLDEDRNVQAWGRRRLSLKPGITGLWQVLGRSDIPFGEMLRLDYIYVTTWSLSNDLKLIFRTIPVLFRGHGAY